jgi:putative transposase
MVPDILWRAWLLQTVLRPARVKGFVMLPKRWIVERTFGWLGRNRRHSKDYGRNTESRTAMIDITMSHLMLRRLARAKTEFRDTLVELAGAAGCVTVITSITFPEMKARHVAGALVAWSDAKLRNPA